MSESQPHWALDCPYYNGKGTCGERGPSCASQGEPLCYTDEPMTGWKRRDERGRFVKRIAPTQQTGTP